MNPVRLKVDLREIDAPPQRGRTSAVRKAARGGAVLLGRTEHRFEDRVLLDRRKKAVRDGAGGRGEEAGQDLGSVARGGRRRAARRRSRTSGWSGLSSR